MDRSGQPVRLWRVTTAIRVFALALAVGSTLGDNGFEQALPTFSALALIACIASALEWDSSTRTSAVLPIAEGILAAILLTIAPTPVTLLVYLAIPPLVAGVRHGWVTVVNASLMGSLAILATYALGPEVVEGAQASESLRWMAMGLGLGLLASWQSRSARDLESRQAPYVEAHHLMSQLHGLTRRGALELDSTQLAGELDAALRKSTCATDSAVFVQGTHAPHLVTSYGDHEKVSEAMRLDPGEVPDEVLLLPLRGNGETLGVVGLCRPDGWDEDATALAQRLTDDYALPLSTAFLFEAVRSMATAEERSRIAREMHDGVAQEVVALGYGIEEIATIAEQSDVRELATQLRDEVSRIVTELRLSIFDLRQDVTDRLSGAIAEYVRVITDESELAAHLTIKESGPPLPVRTQVEILRVAQEAVGNVRRHSQADHLWVSLLVDDDCVRLLVEDDGVGQTRPRERHWGLQTMRERAQTIGARLTITERDGGGTTVLLESRRHSHKEAHT